MKFVSRDEYPCSLSLANLYIWFIKKENDESSCIKEKKKIFDLSYQVEWFVECFWINRRRGWEWWGNTRSFIWTTWEKITPHTRCYILKRGNNEETWNIFLRDVCNLLTFNPCSHTFQNRNLRKRLLRRRRICREMETDSLCLLPPLSKTRQHNFSWPFSLPYIASYTATKVIRNFIRVTFRETKVHVRYSSDIIVKVAKVYGKKKKKREGKKEKKKLSLSIVRFSTCCIFREIRNVELNDLINEKKKELKRRIEILIFLHF